MSNQETSHKVLVNEIPTLDGGTIIARAGPEREMIQFDQDPSIVDWIERDPKLPIWKFFMRKQQYKCGHRGVREFLLRIYGRSVYPVKSKHDELCPDCALEKITQEAIRCCLCGGCILPGDGVCLYDVSSVKTKDFEFKIIENHAVGCLLWNCAPSSLFFVGHWNGVDITPFDFAQYMRK